MVAFLQSYNAITIQHCHSSWYAYMYAVLQVSVGGRRWTASTHLFLRMDAVHPRIGSLQVGRWTGVHPRPPTHFRGGWTPFLYFFSICTPPPVREGREEVWWSATVRWASTHFFFLHCSTACMIAKKCLITRAYPWLLILRSALLGTFIKPVVLFCKSYLTMALLYRLTLICRLDNDR